MRVVVVGGSGRTGALVVKALKANGDTVIATIRSSKHMAVLVKQGVEVVMLDLDTSPLADFEQAFKGAGAVVFAAGSGEGEPSAIDRKGTYRTVLAAEKAGVKRYVTVSSLGASTPVPKSFATTGMKEYFAAKRAGNKKIRASALDWTILEPGELSAGTPAGKIAIGEDGIDNKKIARADVAAVVIAVLGEPKTIGRTFQIVGGTMPIAAAIQSAVKKKPPAAKP